MKASVAKFSLLCLVVLLIGQSCYRKRPDPSGMDDCNEPDKSYSLRFDQSSLRLVPHHAGDTLVFRADSNKRVHFVVQPADTPFDVASVAFSTCHNTYYGLTRYVVTLQSVEEPDLYARYDIRKYNGNYSLSDPATYQRTDLFDVLSVSLANAQKNSFFPIMNDSLIFWASDTRTERFSKYTIYNRIFRDVYHAYLLQPDTSLHIPKGFYYTVADGIVAIEFTDRRTWGRE